MTEAFQQLIGNILTLILFWLAWRIAKKGELLARSDEHRTKHIEIENRLNMIDSKIKEISEDYAKMESDIYSELAVVKKLIEDKFSQIINILIQNKN